MSHPPRQHALEAYAQGRLSAARRARVERHLPHCAACQQLLSAIRAYHVLREEAAHQPLVELSWERLSRALDVPAAPPERRPTARAVALLWPVLAVAATLLIAWIGMSGGSREEAAPLAHKVPAPAVQDEPVLGVVTLVAGHVYLVENGGRQPVQLGTQLPEGSQLISEAGAELHVALPRQTGFILEAASQLTLAELREHSTRLTLTAGSVRSQVHRLAADQRYEVQSQDVLASVRGTRFLVERQQAFRVFVHEGVVEVSQDGRVLARLAAGEQFEAPAPPVARAAPPERSVHALSLDVPTLPPVQLPASRDVSAWLVEGASLSANVPLAMRAPPGPMQLSYLDLRGQLRTVELQVGESGLSLSPGALAKLVAPKELAAGHLEAEQIRRVIAQALDPLRRCYERSLRSAPGLRGKLTLAMRVAPDGHVVRAAPQTSDELPAELSRCIVQEASKLRFPKPEGGGYVSFEVPLNLRAAR